MTEGPHEQIFLEDETILCPKCINLCILKPIELYAIKVSTLLSIYLKINPKSPTCHFKILISMIIVMRVIINNNNTAYTNEC